MAKMMSPNTTIWWVTDATYNPDSPSAAILTGANSLNISAAIVTGYTLNPKASNTDSTKSIVDAGNVKAPTTYAYEGKISFFREGDLTSTTSTYAKAFAALNKKGLVGYLVRRIGMKATVPPAVGQEVSSFKVITDNPQDVVGDKTPIEFTVDFGQQGKMSLYQTLVA